MPERFNGVADRDRSIFGDFRTALASSADGESKPRSPLTLAVLTNAVWLLVVKSNGSMGIEAHGRSSVAAPDWSIFCRSRLLPESWRPNDEAADSWRPRDEEADSWRPLEDREEWSSRLEESTDIPRPESS